MPRENQSLVPPSFRGGEAQACKEAGARKLAATRFCVRTLIVPTVNGLGYLTCATAVGAGVMPSAMDRVRSLVLEWNEVWKWRTITSILGENRATVTHG